MSILSCFQGETRNRVFTLKLTNGNSKIQFNVIKKDQDARGKTVYTL